MFFLLAGLLAVGLKYLEIGPVATWSWWLVLLPFPLAVAWWTWADASGYTKKKEMQKMDQRKDERLKKQRDAMGLLTGKKRK